MRSLHIDPVFLDLVPSSVLIRAGRTRVLCAASVEDVQPNFLEGTGEGWVTAEYAMLPASTVPRVRRAAATGKPRGRTLEIQRLIGRALRAAVDRTRLGPRTVWLDCDVLQADGGTRTASITGGWVALALALALLERRGEIPPGALLRQVAAVSVGIVDDDVVVDLCYDEDARADVDLNVVMSAEGDLIEIQGTAEGNPFDRDRLDAMLDAAWAAIGVIAAEQRRALDEGLRRLEAAGRA